MSLWRRIRPIGTIIFRQGCRTVICTCVSSACAWKMGASQQTQRRILDRAVVVVEQKKSNGNEPKSISTVVLAGYLFDLKCYFSSQLIPLDCLRLILLNLALLSPTKYKCFSCSQNFAIQELTALSTSRIRIANSHKKNHANPLDPSGIECIYCKKRSK